jgi:fucose 4-O-acetylase-like acetyltransferase
MAVITPRTPPTRTVERTAPREAWIDNLRAVIIAGVIGAHVSLIYALDVGWYYEERTASTVAKAVLAGVFSPGLLFGMGLLFFVAGLFTPGALAYKGPRRFIVDRLWRLGVPTIAYLFVINPAMNLFGDRAMGGGEGFVDYLRHTYRYDVELGVAWFIAALLVFSLAWAAWRSRHPARAEDVGSLSRRDLVRAGVLIAIGSFAVRLVWPFLGTGEVIGLNLWEYPQMAGLFVLGALAHERRWLADGLPAQLRRTCGRAAALGLVSVVIVAVGITLADDPDPFLGGFRLEAMVIPVVEATIAVGMSLWGTDWFRRRWNRTTAIARGAGRASFGAYLVHAPITVALAATLRDVGMAAEVKFVAVAVVSVVASFALGWLFTRSHVATRVL